MCNKSNKKISIVFLLFILEGYAEINTKQVALFNNLILLGNSNLNKGVIYNKNNNKQIKGIISYPYLYQKGELADNPIATTAVKSINGIIFANRELIQNKTQKAFSEEGLTFDKAVIGLSVLAVTQANILVKPKSILNPSDLNDISKKVNFIDVSEYEFDQNGQIVFYRTRYTKPSNKNQEKEIIVETISQLPTNNWLSKSRDNTTERCIFFKANYYTGLIEQKTEIDCESYNTIKELGFYKVQNNNLYVNYREPDFSNKSSQLYTGMSGLEFDDQNRLVKLTYGGGFKEDGTIDFYFSEFNEQGDWTKRTCGRRWFTTHNYNTEILENLYRDITYY